ncbi:hypothetical protein BFINE_41220 [Bacteroides finegoldii DSM 17565]|nr:hypothetical protein BFINE_41220 [Bacteroides finegoldii DSM 17565]
MAGNPRTAEGERPYRRTAGITGTGQGDLHQGHDRQRGNLFSAFVRVNHERAKFDFFKWNPDKSKKQEQSQQAAVRQDGTKPANAVSRNRPVQKADKKGYPSDHSHE